jgi:predicted acetyltransferase
MPDLIEPDVARHSAWLDSHREWGPGLHEDGFGIGPDDDVESPAGFAAWVEGIRCRPERFWWIVEQEVVLGGIALRPFPNDQVLRVGHIGYGVRPSARGRGVATWALGQALNHAHEAGLRRVLLVCLDDNAASVKTIERHGGVPEGTIRDGNALIRRYAIDS